MQDIEQLLKVAPPGTCFEIVRITLPTSAAAAMPTLESAESHWTLESVVEWVRSEHGEPGVKLKEWAAMLPGISHRELLRAADDGRLTWHPKPDGRDHGARMASPDAMLGFLTAEGHVRPDSEAGE
jgi:hypothetical protein